MSSTIYDAIVRDFRLDARSFLHAAKIGSPTAIARIEKHFRLVDDAGNLVSQHDSSASALPARKISDICLSDAYMILSREAGFKNWMDFLEQSRKSVENQAVLSSLGAASDGHVSAAQQDESTQRTFWALSLEEKQEILNGCDVYGKWLRRAFEDHGRRRGFDRARIGRMLIRFAQQLKLSATVGEALSKAAIRATELGSDGLPYEGHFFLDAAFGGVIGKSDAINMALMYMSTE